MHARYLSTIYLRCFISTLLLRKTITFSANYQIDPYGVYYLTPCQL